MIFRKTFIYILAQVLLTLSLSSFAQVRLPKLVSDGMVLQRDAEVQIWGWAAPNEQISVSFIDNTYKTKADKDGNWEISLAALSAGGPYTMQIEASNSITIKDILVGDVWICSGQSNMDLPMQRVSWVYPEEIATAENNNIRYFHVPRTYHFKGPKRDLEGGSWVAANSQTVMNFSAVAYFFGRSLNDKYEVPIGLINNSLGGSPVEAWISEDAIKKYPKHYDELQQFKDDALIESIEQEDLARSREWHKLLAEKDKGYQSNPIWYHPETTTKDWREMEIPGYWADEEVGNVNGAMWFRKEVTVPKNIAGDEALLVLGRIVDADSVFVNGQFVGSTGYQYPPRRYPIPGGLLRKGENTIVVRVINQSGKGGFIPDKDYIIHTNTDTLDISGVWKYRLGAEMEQLAGSTFVRWKPVGLFNGMIAPLTNYRIKGAIWYQGESNASRPYEYQELFPLMIKNWRDKWNQPELPFLFVQLANYMEVKDQPGESNWALLREAQQKALTLPNTGMAVAIDVGEWNDIHPVRKKPVGERLALAAQKVAYHEESIISSGPQYDSMKKEGNKIILTFDHTGSGLKARGGNKLSQFAIAGPDKKFVWAKAEIIDENKVVVWSDQIDNPVAVRYAWADNPEGANLYNKEGLPASPFRTDARRDKK